MRWFCALLGGALTVGTVAFASGPRVAIHPLEESQVSAREKVQDGANLVLGALDAKVQLVPPERVTPRVEALPGKSCQGETACLAKLASETGADVALYVNLNTYAPSVRVAWKLVRADGQRIQSGSFESQKKGKRRSDWVIAAVSRLFEVELNGQWEGFTQPVTQVVAPVTTQPGPVGSAPIAAQSVPAPVLAPTREPGVPSGSPVATSSTWMRPVAIGAAVVGVAAMVTGIVVGRSAQSGWKDAYTAAGPDLSPAQQATLLDQRQGYRNRVTVGNALLVGGGVVLAAGAGLFAYDLLKTHGGPQIALGAGGHEVWVAGRF